MKIARWVLALVVLPGVAAAHPGAHEASGFAAGAMHPFLGIDHLVAMLGVGLLAARAGGKAVWALPTAFLAAMAAGGMLVAIGVDVPGIEMGVLLSLAGLAAALIAGVRMPGAVLVGGVALFAVFHGAAHVAEMPADASAWLYSLGFLVATAGLSAIGLALGLAFASARHPTRVPR